jgi:manganese efflux pump family protein
MSTAAMAVWIITVIIGAYLQAAGIGNQHRQAEAASGEAGAGHPLLEFCHPALGVIGLMFWIFYVVSDHLVFAWTAFGMLAATALFGITWLVSGIAGRSRARVPPGPVFPRHLVLLHGVAVTCTTVLVLIAAIGHG